MDCNPVLAIIAYCLLLAMMVSSCVFPFELTIVTATLMADNG